MRDDERGPNPKPDSPDRKTRIAGDRVFHTPQGSIHHGDRYEGPRGLTSEQNEARRTGAKLDERQARQTGFGGKLVKPPVSRLDGTDDVTDVKKGR